MAVGNRPKSAIELKDKANSAITLTILMLDFIGPEEQKQLTWIQEHLSDIANGLEAMIDDGK